MITVTTKDRTPELMQKMEAAIGRFVRKGAAHIEQRLRSSMGEGKSGQAYPRGKSGIHIASAPGESPGIDSSNYFTSLQIIQENSLEATIGTPIEYAIYLEEGTAEIEPRPLWEKTAKDSLPTLERLLQMEIGRAH